MGFCRLLVSGLEIWRAPMAFGASAHVAQLGERVRGKDEVISSILIMGSRIVKCRTQKQTDIKIEIRKPGDRNG